MSVFSSHPGVCGGLSLFWLLEFVSVLEKQAALWQLHSVALPIVAMACISCVVSWQLDWYPPASHYSQRLSLARQANRRRSVA